MSFTQSDAIFGAGMVVILVVSAAFGYAVGTEVGDTALTSFAVGAVFFVLSFGTLTVQLGVAHVRHKEMEGAP